MQISGKMAGELRIIKKYIVHSVGYTPYGGVKLKLQVYCMERCNNFFSTTREGRVGGGGVPVHHHMSLHLSIFM